MAYTKRLVIKALERAGVREAQKLAECYSPKRIVEVGLAYRTALTNNSARGPGWITSALVDDWDVSSLLAKAQQQEESTRMRLYMARQTEDAQLPRTHPAPVDFEMFGRLFREAGGKGDVHHQILTKQGGLIEHATPEPVAKVYTDAFCSRHPQERIHVSGQCPKCFFESVRQQGPAPSPTP